MTASKLGAPCFALLLLLGLLAAGSALAASHTITYQGVLRDSAGDPVPDGAYALSFEIFTLPAAGASLWQESHPAVATTGGAFSVELGQTTAFGTLFQSNPSVHLEVAADTGAGLTPYLPRVPLAGAPYAQQAMNADTVDGVHAAALEESAEIVTAVTTHDTNANAHANINLDGARITTGKIANARLNTGSGQGLDADTVDGVQAAALEESAEIIAAVAAHSADGAAHADIRGEIDADVTAHNTDANAHANLDIEAAQITSGTIDNIRLNMGSGGGLDADLLDGLHASAFATPASVAASVTAHNTDAAAHANIQLDGARITTGSVNIARLPTGTGATQVALGNHTHDASAIVSGTMNVGRLPVGTGAGQVAAGDHTHAANWKVTKAIAYGGAALTRNGSFVLDNANSTLFIHAAASGYRGNTGLMGVFVQVDGVTRGTLRGYTNEASSHKTLIPDIIILPGGTLSAGNHSVSLVAEAGTNTDANDFSHITVHELKP